MERPEGMPEWAWDEATNGVGSELVYSSQVEIARALLAAYERGREEVAKWHETKQSKFKERAEYMRDRGWRTHCTGAVGAERAADDYERLANYHGNSATAIRETKSHD